ncbi:GNAT family N-acetyltransferase [Adhaeribacter soli]|uniref:GNAT family N-acetyltransferase n=1 Tax=Adhaeribacter soli TaxID=2607655 RepID=A0A5N1J3L1_9BACT|nr:GNAT family N-acetyltransferase [Adhaeribacter soli]KAA9340685.1 GNAT family N-acetyltransferase [Adhaeribacter soli]
MAELFLTPVSATDLPRLRELALATWEPTYKDILSREQLLFMQEEIYTLPALQKQQNEGQEFFFISVNAALVGFLSVTLKDATEGRYKLNKIYLLPQRQGKGFGKKALSAAGELVKSKGGKVLELNVNRYNPARHFYEHCGYTIIREEDIPIGPYWMNDFVMEKRLD